MRGVLLILFMTTLLTACGGNDTQRASPAEKPDWSEAQRLLRTCQVSSVEQTHSQTVTLKLRSGRIVIVHEPEIDDVFRVLQRLPLSCAPRTVGTE